jgi:hypothetical protein
MCSKARKLQISILGIFGNTARITGQSPSREAVMNLTKLKGTTMEHTTKLSILAAALLVLAPGQAFSLPESESNHPLTNAQALSNSASQVQISGAISRDHDANDVDFFSFRANEGDVLTLDIDYGFSNDEDGVDTIIAIFDANGRGLRANDDASVDPGSQDRRDSRIENFLVPATGTYIVGVSSYPRHFGHGGGVRSGPLDEGSYELIIDGLPVSMMQISMEVKPGNNDVSPPINPKSKGKIPVALLGSKSFDVKDVDVNSLTFGASGHERSLHKCAKHTKDVNRDGHPDLVCHFYTQKSRLGRAHIEGRLNGRTNSRSGGVPFQGASYLKVIPDKKAAD